jgi:hypothetical protein
MRLIQFCKLLAVVAMGMAYGNASAAIIRDFNAGIGPVVNHPYPTAAFDTWYDITSDSFATPAAGTLDGSPSLRINDGGFTNGAYIILQSVVPTTGVYRLEAAMKVTEDPAQLNSIRAFQMGAVVNGVHRTDATTPNDIATINPAAPGSGIGSYAGLTTGNDNGLATQIVVTDTFLATAGDHLLVAFSTDLDTGNFDDNSGTWGAGGFVLVDNVNLVLIPEPASFTMAGLALAGLVAARRRA